MKLIILAALLTSSFAMADAKSDSFNHDRLTRWIKSTLNGQTGSYVLGTTPDGKLCSLNLTDKFGGIYFVVVDLYDSKDKNDFVGISTDSVSINTNGFVNLMILQSDKSWGNDSKKNQVQITFDSPDNGAAAVENPGRAASAVATSDLKQIICNFTVPSSNP